MTTLNVENPLMKRLQHIAGISEDISINSFEQNDTLFTDIVKAVFNVPRIHGVTESQSTRSRSRTTKTEKETNVRNVLKLLDILMVDTKQIKPTEVLQADSKLLGVLKEILMQYIEKTITNQCPEIDDSDTINIFLAWINKQLDPWFVVDNFTVSWKNGFALGALMNSLRPGLCPEWSSFKTDNTAVTVSNLMSKAEKQLNVIKLIEPTQMTCQTPDELLLVIYLSQFLEVGKVASKEYSSSYYSQVEDSPRASTSHAVSTFGFTDDKKTKSDPLNQSSAQGILVIDSGQRLSSETEKRNQLNMIRYKPQHSIEAFWQEMDKHHVRYNPRVRKDMTEVDLKLGKPLDESVHGGRQFFLTRYIHSEEGFRMAVAKLSVVSDMQTVQNFLKEAYFVINVNHKNLIPLLELTIHSGRPCMIFPFYKNGNVSAYLKKNQNTSQAKLIDFAVDIAEGLKYIHNNNYIYCELMAGNCLVTDDLTIVLSQFSHTHDSLEDHYEANQLLTSSWKWFALELLKNETVFTTETDVWAFGIVLYEVFSKGKEPYDDISTPHYLLQTLEDGNPLTQPPDCPDCIYDVMKKCWNKDPALRPSISSIFDYLKTAQSQTEVKKRITSSSNAYVG